MQNMQKTIDLENVSFRISSLIAGAALLLMTILAPIAHFGILQKLIVPEDPALTYSALVDSENSLRIAVFLFLVVAILDIIVAWALYLVFRPENSSISLLSAWLRIVYSAIFAFVANNLLQVIPLLGGVEPAAAFTVNQLHAQVMQYLDAFQSGWNLSLSVFGLHLAILGILVFKSVNFPKFLGVLVFIAGIGYLVDSFSKVLFSDYALTVSMYTFIGEVLLIFWLFWRGARGPRKEILQEVAI